MNGIIAKQKFSAHLIYLSFSKFIYLQNMFWSMNLAQICKKLCYFHWKIVKIAQRLRALPPDPLCLRRPQTLALTLSCYEFLSVCLIITFTFRWH